VLRQRVDTCVESPQRRRLPAPRHPIDIRTARMHRESAAFLGRSGPRIVVLDSSAPRGLHDCLEHSFHLPGISVLDPADRKTPQLNQHEREVRQRIETLVESVRDDQARSQQLFHYVWTMICVHRGLMRVVREVRSREGIQLVLEEVKTGRHRLVSRPVELDHEVEGLAIQALTKILGDINVTSVERS
jgi:hypothetical protein